MKKAEELKAEGGIESGSAAFSAQALFAGMVAQDFECQFANHGAVVRSGLVTDLAMK